MKKLRYIFLLLIAVLSGFAISSCEDDDVVAAEVTEEAAEGSGETVKTTFTINLSAPDVSADLDPVTRAGDNANIEYAKPENGGRFQNIVVVLVGPPTGSSNKHKIYGTHFYNWNDGVGVKEYNVIFSDVNIDKDNDLGKDFMVYAFGNLPNTLFETLPIDDKGEVGKYVEDWIQFYYWCVQSSVSVTDVYNINFKPGNNYTLSYKYSGSTRSLTYASSGMPVNNSVKATVVKGNTQFNVAMKRVCARLQVTFRNFTGTYIDYETSTNKENNVYVDKFEIKNVLANKANYFCNNTTSLTGVTSSNFDILQALGGSKTNDHIINKIENGKDLVVSMYVFENNKGGYQYDLKVDRGKSLGSNTTTIDPENAYVIWNNQAHHSLACNGTVINASEEQLSNDRIPFSDQVFWKIENAPSAKLSDTYVLRHCKLNKNTDVLTIENNYLQQQGDPSDWGMHFYCSKCEKAVDWNHYFYNFFAHASSISYTLVDSEFSHTLKDAPVNGTDNAQYVNFVLDKNNQSTISKYTFNLLNKSDKKKNQNYWEEVQRNYRYLFLTVGLDDGVLKCVRGAGYNTSQTLGNFDWTLYAKYIIKNGQQFKDNSGNISQIERNHSYELDFSVMPNYDTKQEILVNCIRKQNEVNWSEVEK